MFFKLVLPETPIYAVLHAHEPARGTFEHAISRSLLVDLDNGVRFVMPGDVARDQVLYVSYWASESFYMQAAIADHGGMAAGSVLTVVEQKVELTIDRYISGIRR